MTRDAPSTTIHRVVDNNASLVGPRRHGAWRGSLARAVPLTTVPLTTATALFVAALSSYGAQPLSIWNEAYPHVTGHLVSAAVAALVAAAAWALVGSASKRGARRAALVLTGGWAVLAGARALEAVGGTVGNGSGENVVHAAGVLLSGPGLVVAVLAHVAVVLASGSVLPWLLRAGLAVTPLAWFGVEDAGSGPFLLLGVAAAAAWLMAGLLTLAATVADQRAAVPSGSAVTGGLFWMFYGVLELLEPWGPDTRYDRRLGYDVVVDPILHVAYSGPGALALVLSGVAIAAAARRLAVSSHTAPRAGVVAAVLGVVSGAGVIVSIDPVFTGPRVLGTLVLAGGVLALAIAAPPRYRMPLAALAAVAFALLPLWPLVYAVGSVSAGAAAGLVALHGAGWVAVGLCLGVPASSSRSAGAARSSVASSGSPS